MLTTIILSILGVAGAGGLGLLGLGSLGIGGGLVAWFAAKNIPWKLILTCVLALFVCVAIFATYKTLKNTRDELEAVRIELVQEKVISKLQKLRADNYVVQHTEMVGRFNTLETTRSSVSQQAVDIGSQITDMTLEQDLNNDAAKAIDSYNSYNDKLNGLLGSASRGAGSGKLNAAGADKASTTRTTSALQRALQALR